MNSLSQLGRMFHPEKYIMHVMSEAGSVTQVLLLCIDDHITLYSTHRNPSKNSISLFSMLKLCASVFE